MATRTKLQTNLQRIFKHNMKNSMDKNNHNPTSQHMNFHITFQRCSIAKLLNSYKKLSFMNSLKYESFNNTTYPTKQNPPAIHKIN